MVAQVQLAARRWSLQQELRYIEALSAIETGQKMLEAGEVRWMW